METKLTSSALIYYTFKLLKTRKNVGKVYHNKMLNSVESKERVGKKRCKRSSNKTSSILDRHADGSGGVGSKKKSFILLSKYATSI